MLGLVLPYPELIVSKISDRLDTRKEIPLLKLVGAEKKKILVA